MIAFDTNVLLRLFVKKDDPDLSARAERALARYAPVYLSDVTLAEFAWVCRRKFKMARRDIIQCVDALVEAPEFVVRDEDVVASALHGFRSRKSDFADWLIGEANKAAGCEMTLTFDESAAKSALFALVEV